MRTIKFRVWTGDRMIYQPETPLLNNPFDFWAGYSPDGIWMQFTGLLDKNGKEIYEGDILRHISDGNAPHWPIAVRWDVFAWWYGNDLLKPNEMETQEIIGNIYENPDLLTKTST